MKKLLFSFFVLCVTTVLNFSLFSIAYNQLATPYLHESQRTDNAEIIMMYILPSYLVIAIISSLLAYFVSRRMA